MGRKKIENNEVLMIVDEDDITKHKEMRLNEYKRKILYLYPHTLFCLNWWSIKKYTKFENTVFVYNSILNWYEIQKSEIQKNIKLYNGRLNINKLFYKINDSPLRYDTTDMYIEYIYPNKTSIDKLRIKFFINYDGKRIYQTNTLVYSNKEARLMISTDHNGNLFDNKTQSHLLIAASKNNENSSIKRKYTDINETENEFKNEQVYSLSLLFFYYLYTFSYVMNIDEYIIGKYVVFIKAYEFACRLLKVSNINLDYLRIINPNLYITLKKIIPSFDYKNYCIALNTIVNKHNNENQKLINQNFDENVINNFEDDIDLDNFSLGALIEEQKEEEKKKEDKEVDKLFNDIMEKNEEFNFDELNDIIEKNETFDFDQLKDL